MKLTLPILYVLLCSAGIKYSFHTIRDNADSTLFRQSDLKLISSDFAFTEGCSTDKAGNVFFTDQPNDKIWKYDMVTEKLSLFLEKTGRANGTYFDKKGNLITCSDEKGEIWSVNRKGKARVIYKSPQGQQLNGPNDVWIDSFGGFYFTDPFFKRNYWSRTTPDLKNESIYYLTKNGQKALLLDSNFKRPNGIVGTPDGKTLYVADGGDNKTYSYQIDGRGKLSNRKLLIARGSDGMTLDHKGNLYLTGKGVAIYNPKGELLGTITTNELTTNVCFAGKNRDVLFIAARKSVYLLPMKVHGVE